MAPLHQEYRALREGAATFGDLLTREVPWKVEIAGAMTRCGSERCGHRSFNLITCSLSNL